MKVGMLWFDESRDLEIEQRIERASEYYHSKYGQKPNVCFVHPEAIDEDSRVIGSALKVRSSETLLQDHFWIGIEEEME